MKNFDQDGRIKAFLQESVRIAESQALGILKIRREFYKINPPIKPAAVVCKMPTIAPTITIAAG